MKVAANSLFGADHRQSGHCSKIGVMSELPTTQPGPRCEGQPCQFEGKAETPDRDLADTATLVMPFKALNDAETARERTKSGFPACVEKSPAADAGDAAEANLAGLIMVSSQRS